MNVTFSALFGAKTEGIFIRYRKSLTGTRGIALLLLYLGIDKNYRRPLIIDQPKENLDPKSVFDELVPHFRERGRGAK